MVIEAPMMVTMLAALGSLIAVLFESFRKSRCVSIKSCCGLFEIEREIDEEPENNNDVSETRSRRNSRNSDDQG
mgnify:CR=1 FL=1|tara:strand:- start:1125 stop:1346 length:222 start_codon:yes stop_codon:yes gene_type:complete